MRAPWGFVAMLTAAALIFAGSCPSGAAEPESANKRVAVGYLETLLNKHDAAAAYRLCAAPDFHHHAQ